MHKIASIVTLGNEKTDTSPFELIEDVAETQIEEGNLLFSSIKEDITSTNVTPVVK